MIFKLSTDDARYNMTRPLGIIMNSQEIRKKFLDFFERNGHTVVSSSPLIPAQDPTLLFTNAGMNQFKDAFLGKEKRSYVRATSMQKCVRAGGKHNDLDQVGFTERHLTFFEMMGNFSFGDYFKKEAITFAWDFLTGDMGFDGNTLYPTVFEKDDEAFELWHTAVPVSKERITRLGASENFWQMGDTGPCGPCSEILIDRGAEKGCGKASCAPGCDCPRYTEVWNLVFMQYDRQADGTLVPLKQTGVDTGMGFERLCMISQDKESVFDIDVFEHIYKKLEDMTGLIYSKATPDVQVAFRVLSDHIRSSCLIMADGGSPSNEGRGYVLRKIIRRAALFAKNISDDPALFPKLGKAFIDDFSSVYPELKAGEDYILKMLRNELSRFSENLLSGQHILNRYLTENTRKNNNTLTGHQVFKLYDTYGFPLELTSAVAKEKGFEIDIEGFEKEMEKQQEQSGKKSMIQTDELAIPENLTTEFVGYEYLESKSVITHVSLSSDHAWVVAEKTPFYVESGGQVDDQGWVLINSQKYPLMDLKKVNDAIAMQVSTKDIKNPVITVGDEVHCVVDSVTRWDTVRNHTATHLLQAALIQVLGNSVKQAGSVVHERYLRFDFTHHDALTEEQTRQIEDLINQKIMDDIPTKIYTTTLAASKEAGVISFFGEKYNPENVRVVEVPGFSSELCGGTHAPSTGIIGCFKITSEAALSTGVRRIFAVTGHEAIRMFQDTFKTTKKLSEHFKVKPEGTLQAVEKLEKNYLDAQRDIRRLKKQLWRSFIPAWSKQVKTVGPVPFLYLELEDMGNDDLKEISNALQEKNPGLYFLVAKSSEIQNKASFFCQLSRNYTENVDLKKLSTFLKDHGLRGGGSNVLMQGGGMLPENFGQSIRSWLSEA